MKKRPLGNTDIHVSLICLGTMTWGEQNTQEQAHEQLDYAVAQGVNFIDAAEMYPVPPRAETQGLTETYLGAWLKRQQRDKLIIATKVTGRSDGFDYLGRGETRLNRQQIHQAIDQSLKRLQTDYIDLYQLHWPERSTNFFGQLGYTHQPSNEGIALEETLETLQEFVKAGKVRHVGMSNETPWGMMEYVRLAETKGLPRMVSIQNPYNLLNRTFEVGAAECAIRAQCGLLAYSPLGFGVLSGKYLNGQKPEKARLTLFTRFQRYTSQKAQEATTRYVALAREHGLSPAQMALAYVNQQPFVTSNIIGATNMRQLKENIGSTDVQLSSDVLTAIERIHQDIPNPCP
jgi:aryl-alcohol dehydrogenase-like predicted oxidoreductase